MTYKNPEKRDSTALLSEVDENDRPNITKKHSNMTVVVGDTRGFSQSTLEGNKKQDILVKDIRKHDAVPLLIKSHAVNPVPSARAIQFRHN